jgi:hypothetical protein
VIETVLEQLITWAASAVEATNNQPILPYAIIVLNASPHDIDPRLWDIDFATRSLFDSLSKTVTQNDVFDKYAKAWQKRGRKIESVEELMNCYYSSVKVSQAHFWKIWVPLIFLQGDQTTSRHGAESHA